MAKLSAQEFIIKYIARFANNTTGQIDEADLRDFARDIADSFGGSLDYEQLNLEWNSETTYNTTDTQYSEAFGRLYKSKQDGNIGHQPPSAPNVDGDYEDDWWEEISKAAGSLFVEWEPKAYGSGLVIVFYDNTFRKLNVQQRPFLSQDIEAETNEEKWTVIGGSGPSHFLGKYTTLAALETAIPTATDGDYAIVDPGAGTPAVEYIWDAEEGWVAGGEAVDISGKADKITGGTNGNLVERDANGNIVDAGISKNQVLQVSQLDVTGYDNQETRLLSIKNNNGTPEIGTPVKLLDQYLPESVVSQLGENAAWGNIAGKSGDYIRLTGNNLEGGLGESGQWCEINGIFIQAIFHSFGTTVNNGFCEFVRNNSRDALDIEIPYHAEIISRLVNTANWDGTTQTKIISDRKCRVGSWYVNPSGYMYFCFDEDGLNFYWKRFIGPDTYYRQIANAALKAEIEAHDFGTTKILAPVSATKGQQGQVHCWENPAGTPHVAQCELFGINLRWVKKL